MNRSLLAATCLCVACLACWHGATAGTIDPAVIAFHGALVATIVMAGRMVGARLAAAAPVTDDLPAVLLLGLLAVHLGLLLLKSLPLPPTVAPCLLLVVACGLFVRDPKWREHPVRVTGWPLAATALALLAATLWSASGFAAIVPEGDEVRFRPWSDAFYHSTWISAFAQAYGVWSAGHNLLANVTGEVYSFGDYLVPGELVALTGARAYDVANALWVPLGLFATGAAAYLLAAGWWSARAGFGAVLGVLCLPDASDYFLQNEFLGYHWLNFVSAGGAWGVAAAAVTVLAVEAVCRSGSRLAAGVAAAAALLTFFFKAQILLALVPLIVLIEVVGCRRWALRWRLLGLLACGALALLGPFLADALLPGLSLRLDGSGAKPYLQALVTNGDGALRAMTAGITATSSWWSDAAIGAPYLLLATFGPALLLVVAFGLGWQWRTKRLGLVSLFPVALVAIYLALTLGLSANGSGRHTSDALVHRPFVWYYFGLATWAGGFVVDFVGRWRPLAERRRARIVAAALAVVAGVAFVAVQGRTAAYGPSWSTGFCDQRVGRGFVDCAAYLRGHARVGDVVQDSRGDPLLVLAALAERRCCWMTSPLLAGAIPDLAQRGEHVAALLAATDRDSIRATADTAGIDWLVTHPDEALGWPADRCGDAAFTAGGFAVYRLR